VEAPTTLPPVITDATVPDPCPSECMDPLCTDGNLANGGQPMLISSALTTRCPYRCSAPIKQRGFRFSFCGIGADYEGAGSTDCSACVEAPPPGKCIVQGYYYYPHSHTRFPESLEAGWKSCQSRCKADIYCKYFGYWPDAGCLMQGTDAKLVNSAAMCEGDSANCTGRVVISGPEDCGPDYYSMYPNTAAAKPAPKPAPECTVTGEYWTPAMENKKTIQASWRWCQAACKAEPECAHFAFWPDGGCMLQDGNSTVVKSTSQCYEAATDATNATTCDGSKVISGPKECAKPVTATPPGPCTVEGYYYEPVGPRYTAATFESCQLLCYDDLDCKKVAYWPDGGCHFQNLSVKLTKADCSKEDAEGKECPARKVIAGAQMCGPNFYSEYPILAGAAPPAPAPFLADKESSSSSGVPWGWLFIGIIVLGILLAVLLYGMGFCDEEKRKKKKQKKLLSRRDSNKAAELLVAQEKPLSTSAVPVATYAPVTSGGAVAYQSVPQVQVGVPGQVQQQQPQGLFEMVDRNHDGVVSREEWQQAMGRPQGP